MLKKLIQREGIRNARTFAVENRLLKLRQLTNLPVMECKKALVEANGNIEQAARNLMKQYNKEAKLKQISELPEGIVVMSAATSAAVGLRLCCQTDFAANSQVMQDTIKVIFEELQRIPGDLKRCYQEGYH
eukprot:TRINITY_DN3576_c0_g1_i2.p1 TRINITY_DN3576_c0_g1~~TRINITY_DN3576_c0_g1_i2.p1  ORF type:complete len:131 (-),score=15.56 TRINITY_DN3576_c0_g1_i2:62-454(-)